MPAETDQLTLTPGIPEFVEKHVGVDIANHMRKEVLPAHSSLLTVRYFSPK